MWATLAPLLAGQARVRISRDAGKSYPARFERALTVDLPIQPAAVRIFGRDGTCKAIFLDFDSSVGGVELVLSDVRAVTSWLGALGARWIEDYSPNGGRHVYVPLNSPVTFDRARDFVEALGTAHSSLDCTPHQNIGHGCMRVPGSPHKRGGHQLLATGWESAQETVQRPNSAGVWAALVNDLRDDIAEARGRRAEKSAPAPKKATAGAATALHKSTDATSAIEPIRGMSRAMLNIASAGIYDTGRYSSPSEARQAVLVAAAAAGLALTDVDRRMKQGIWPGLAQFYTRYSSANRFGALSRDWTTAQKHVAANHRQSTVRRNYTSQQSTQPRASQPSNLESEHRSIRTWRNALHFADHRLKNSREGQAQRMILRALGEAAHKAGSTVIEFGVRALAIASGVHPTTVAEHLRALRNESDPMIRLLEAGRGVRGDQYELRVPSDLQDAADERSWDSGKLHALRPVFRELGMPAAFLYEALERADVPSPTAALALAAGLSRSAASEALDILAAWGLAERRGPAGGWVIRTGASLTALAEQLGVIETITNQISMYRAQRLLWHQWLADSAPVLQLLPHPHDDYPWEQFEGPPPDDWALADLAFSWAE